MKEFFGLSKVSENSYGFLREAEGAWSWQHLSFVFSLLVLMTVLAIWLGMRNKHRSDKQKNTVLVVCAFLINGFELLKIVVLCIRCQNALHWLYVLPLFLCSLQLIAIPLAAFCKGRVKEASLDFVFLFGILGAVFGTIGAAQNYSAYPTLSMDNVFSGITHTISGFASIYIGVSGMMSMKKKNIPIVVGLIVAISILAYAVNLLVDYNYMFLMNHDGTPYSLVYNLVNGNRVLYPILVVALFILYIGLFDGVYYLIQNKLQNKKAAATETEN